MLRCKPLPKLNLQIIFVSKQVICPASLVRQNMVFHHVFTLTGIVAINKIKTVHICTQPSSYLVFQSKCTQDSQSLERQEKDRREKMAKV